MIQSIRATIHKYRRLQCATLVAACVLSSRVTCAQGLTGTLIGTVKDAQGAVLAGAVVRLTSPALIGGPMTAVTDASGQMRFPGLPPGVYTLDVESTQFAPRHEENLPIAAGSTLERTVVLSLGNVAESVTVEQTTSGLDPRTSGLAVRFGEDNLTAIPLRRTSMFDMIRIAPGISPTSPSNGIVTTISAFGSGTNENQFLFDGTNFTCPCNGVARAEPGIDFMQEVQVQAVGVSAEYGNLQGAVINVVTRRGSERYQFDASYYAQASALTSQPVQLAYPGSGLVTSGYERAGYGDVTTSFGGPILHDRLWFFAGYQHLRDDDSQPGTDPAFPRIYRMQKVFEKVTWKLSRSLQFEQSFHGEVGLNPDRPTNVTTFAATSRRHISVPATTFGHLTQTLSSNTLWDARVGRFVYTQDDTPSSGDPSIASRLDRTTGVMTAAPLRIGSLVIQRTTAKATLEHYRGNVLGVDHQWKIGGQLERGEHHAINMTPTGVRYVDNAGQPFQSVSTDPASIGGLAITSSAFATDALTIGSRLTVNAGVRFDHSRAISQDLPAVDLAGHPTSTINQGLGDLYAWNIVSPRLGATLKLTSDGRSVVRASYGRFSQGVMTGELESFHPGAMPTTTRAFDAATGGYTRIVSVVDPRVNLLLDRDTRAPHTDEYSIGLDRELHRRLDVGVAYVHKVGADFIGWVDVGGVYHEQLQLFPDGSVTTYVLDNGTANRRFLLTNQDADSMKYNGLPQVQDGYSMKYDGLVLTVEKRRSNGWQARASYTASKAFGLLPSSGTSAAGAQTNTVSPPSPLTFGRDPNDLTNALGRLANDRPHMFRSMGTVDVPRTGIVLAANFQYVSGKPWATTRQILLLQGDTRVQLEPRGTRRLPSQSLLDVRFSRAFALGPTRRLELFVDVLNVLDDAAEEGLATDNRDSPNFGNGVAFVDPRRAMIGVKISLDR